MHTRHPHDVDLTWEQVREALVALEGSRVAVRVVERSDPEMLLAVSRATLERCITQSIPRSFGPSARPADRSPPIRKTPRSTFNATATT